jgi:hypothetical protein
LKSPTSPSSHPKGSGSNFSTPSLRDDTALALMRPPGYFVGTCNGVTARPFNWTLKTPGQCERVQDLPLTRVRDNVSSDSTTPNYHNLAPSPSVLTRWGGMSDSHQLIPLINWSCGVSGFPFIHLSIVARHGTDPPRSNSSGSMTGPPATLIPCWRDRPLGGRISARSLILVPSTHMDSQRLQK